MSCLPGKLVLAVWVLSSMVVCDQGTSSPGQATSPPSTPFHSHGTSSVSAASLPLPAPSPGQNVAAVIDALQVDKRWPHGKHVSWLTGLPNNARATQELGPHSGAFAAAVAERLGIFMLRPPLGSQLLLAQCRWLASSNSSAVGWQKLSGGHAAAQASAAAGYLTLMVLQPQGGKISSGFIAVVRPDSSRSLAYVQRHGPDVAAAWIVNHNRGSGRNFLGDSFYHYNVTYYVFKRPLATQLPTSLTANWQNMMYPSATYMWESAPGGRVNTAHIYQSKYPGTPRMGFTAYGADLSGWCSTHWYYNLGNPMNTPAYNPTDSFQTRQNIPLGFQVFSKNKTIYYHKGTLEGGYFPTQLYKRYPGTGRFNSKAVDGGCTHCGFWWALDDTQGMFFYTFQQNSTRLEGILTMYAGNAFMGTLPLVAGVIMKDGSPSYLTGQMVPLYFEGKRVASAGTSMVYEGKFIWKPWYINWIESPAKSVRIEISGRWNTEMQVKYSFGGTAMFQRNSWHYAAPARLV